MAPPKLLINYWPDRKFLLWAETFSQFNLQQHPVLPNKIKNMAMLKIQDYPQGLFVTMIWFEVWYKIIFYVKISVVYNTFMAQDTHYCLYPFNVAVAGGAVNI